MQAPYVQYTFISLSAVLIGFLVGSHFQSHMNRAQELQQFTLNNKEVPPQRENQFCREEIDARVANTSECEIYMRNNMPSFRKIYQSYRGPYKFHHWLEFADFYENEIPRERRVQSMCGHKLILLEIGVSEGGSTRVWKKFFGSGLVYVGLDVNPKSKKAEDASLGIFVHTGSQTDISTLNFLCRKYGPFDVIVDDGGHTGEQIITSFTTLFTCLKDNGIYFIEDTHTMALFLQQRESPKISEQSSKVFFEGRDVAMFFGDVFRNLHAYWLPSGRIFAESRKKEIELAERVSKISMYDSFVAVHRRKGLLKLTNIQS